MLQLNDHVPLAEGMDRLVYPYPGQNGLCIKIPKYKIGKEMEITEFRDRIFLLTRFGNRSHLDYNYTDVQYSKKLERRRTPSVFNHLPRCHGFIETDLGTGVVWEYIRNDDGSPSVSFRHYKLNPDLLGEQEKASIWKALHEFFEWQIQHAVMLREMAYGNTLIRQLSSGDIRLYHVDAIGCVDLIPIAAYSRFVARLRVKSKVRHFRKKMTRWLGAPQTM